MAESCTDGFVCVTTGAPYVPEAQHLAETLRRQHSKLPFCRIADGPPAEHA